MRGEHGKKIRQRINGRYATDILTTRSSGSRNQLLFLWTLEKGRIFIPAASKNLLGFQRTISQYRRSVRLEQDTGRGRLLKLPAPD